MESKEDIINKTTLTIWICHIIMKENEYQV